MMTYYLQKKFAIYKDLLALNFNFYTISRAVDENDVLSDFGPQPDTHNHTAKTPQGESFASALSH